jgi:DNA-binding SARP family transcriptional activator
MPEAPAKGCDQRPGQALTNLRRLLRPAASPSPVAGQPLLTITRQTVQLHRDADLLWVDVHAFDSLLAAADPRRTAALEEIDAVHSLAEAVTLYQGPFLAGLSLPDSREFEEWLMLRREQHHQATMLALDRLVSHYLAEGRTEMVQQYAHRQLGLDATCTAGYWRRAKHSATGRSLQGRTLVDRS